jgi:UDP-glucose 4-epimerase
VNTLVVGRGLLGRAALASLTSRGDEVCTVDVPWGAHRASIDALQRAADRIAANGPWRLVWTAGSGVIATGEAELRAEETTFEGFLGRLSVPPDAMFLASSAGGTYAGSADAPPFTERSSVGPASLYGRTKLAMEAAATELARDGTRVLIGRIANLYGPGQNLAKPQGLVSQLCLSHLTRQPVTIYAAMDSLRDYVFVSDAASTAVSGLDRISRAEPGAVVVKIIASGVSRSVGSVIGESTRAFRRRPNLVVRRAANQIMDLRLGSVTWPDLDRQVDHVPFGVGLRRTSDDIGRQMRAGTLRHPTVRRGA